MQTNLNDVSIVGPYNGGMAERKRPFSKRPRTLRYKDVYAHIGQRIRERRTFLSMSQAQLAELIEVHHSEVHKWETAQRPIFAATLHDIAHHLSTDVSYFFASPKADTEEPITAHQQLALAMARNFARINHPELADVAARVIRALANASLEISSPVTKKRRRSSGKTEPTQ